MCQTPSKPIHLGSPKIFSFIKTWKLCDNIKPTVYKRYARIFAHEVPMNIIYNMLGLIKDKLEIFDPNKNNQIYTNQSLCINNFYHISCNNIYYNILYF